MVTASPGASCAGRRSDRRGYHRCSVFSAERWADEIKGIIRRRRTATVNTMKSAGENVWAGGMLSGEMTGCRH